MDGEVRETRTETIIRRFDTEGTLVSEVTTTVVVAVPANAHPDPGCYP